MVRGVSVVAIAFAFGAAGCLRARGTPEEPVVVGFRIVGASAVSEDAIKAKLATQASGRFAWDTARRLDPEALAADRRRIEAYYRERGYYQARVEDVKVEPAGRGRVRVTMRVAEGPPVRVSKVTVNGLEAAPEAQQRLGTLPLHPADIFSYAAYDGAAGAITSALHSTGWADGHVTQRAEVHPESATAEVTYDVDPGRRWKFGPIIIQGTAQLHDRITDQVLGALTPGEWFDDTRLAQAQQRVFGLGVFGSVRVLRWKADPEGGTLAVIVVVREAPFRTVRAGPGLGFQVIRTDTHAMLSWENRNFHGELRHVSTEASVGYAWLPSPFRREKQGVIGLLSGEFSQPGAFTRYVDASTRLELEKGIEQAYEFYSERVRFSLPLRLASRWKILPSYNFEVYELSRVGQLNTNLPQGGRVLENCRGNVCLLTYLEERIAWDGRDDPINTRRGVYAAFAVQEGFDVGTYGYRYLRFFPELRFFSPLGTAAVLAARARIGALVPVNETGEPPLVARFYAGGPQSMRGYYTRRLSKMLQDPQGNWVPVGGNGLADGSLELRIDVTGNFGAAIFLDAGNVSDASSVPSTWQTALDPTLLQFAAGVGLRYRSPLGPLRIDVAARLPDRTGALTSKSFPAVPYTVFPDGTPHREPIVAVHFSLGEAF